MENYINYIKAGVGLVSPNFYIKACLALFILAFLGFVPGIVLGGFWMGLFVLMALLAIGVTVSICFLKFKGLSTKNDLIMQTIMCCGWTFELVLLECMVASNLFGVQLYLLLLVLQPFIIPSILAYFNERALRVGRLKSSKGVLISGGVAFGLSGIIGMSLGKVFFKDVSQGTAVIIVLCCCSVLVFLFSIGLISVHQLYHFKKYEKEHGPFPD